MADAALAHFTEVTGSTPEVATQYLQLGDYNLETAMQLYFENGGAALQPSTTEPTERAETSTQAATSRSRAGAYEDEAGVVHIDSDSDGSEGRRGPTFDDDLAMARRLQEELYAGGPADVGSVRAPIASTTERLVGPEDELDDDDINAEVMRQLGARQRARDGRPGIFNQRTVTSSIWNDDDVSTHRSILSAATGGASETSAKSSMLAEMFRPPFEIMTKLPWDMARDEGRDKEKWLLVNIQDSSVFDCQVLNRDIWKNPGIMDTVREHFIFLQFTKDDPRGAQYLQYYFPGFDVQDNYPHIAIVDPRTGEQVKVWSGPPLVKAADFLMQLHEFLDRYSLSHDVRNPVARRKPDVKPEKKVEAMTEEEMLELAMRNSLEGQANRRHEDPDELTRSLEDHKGKGKSRAIDLETEDTSSPEIPVQVTNGHEEGQLQLRQSSVDTDPFLTIPSDRPHIEPPADPETTTRIQFRHSSGRIIRRFTLADPVQRIYEWLKSSPLEGKEGVPFDLVLMGQNLIVMLDSTIEDAGLKNGTVMVGFVED